MSRLFRVAIDGPAASGKSTYLDVFYFTYYPRSEQRIVWCIGTTAKLLAKKLGFGYIDSGAMYRAVRFH